MISTLSVHWAKQGRAARRAPPPAPGGPGRLAAFLGGPAPRAAPLPGARESPAYLPSRPATWIDPHSRRPWRPLGLGSADTSPHAHPAGWPGRRRTPPGRKCTGVQYGGREETERRRRRGAGASRLHRTQRRASQTASPRFCAWRAQPGSQLCVLKAGTEGCTCQPGAGIGPASAPLWD